MNIPPYSRLMFQRMNQKAFLLKKLDKIPGAPDILSSIVIPITNPPMIEMIITDRILKYKNKF